MLRLRTSALLLLLFAAPALAADAPEAELASALAPLQQFNVRPGLAARLEARIHQRLDSFWPRVLDAPSMSAAAAQACRAPGCWLRTAERVGVQRLVMGRITESDQGVELLLRLFDVRSGLLLRSEGSSCVDCDLAQLESLASTLADRFGQERDPTAVPVVSFPPAHEQRQKESAPAFVAERAKTHVQDGLVLEARLVPQPRLGCTGLGQSLPLKAELKVRNMEPSPRVLEGLLSVQVFRLGDAQAILDLSQEVRRELAAAKGEDATEGLQPDRLVLALDWDQPISSIEPLRVRIGWNDVLLTEVDTRPAAMLDRIVSVGFLKDGEPVESLPAGGEVELSVLVEKGSHHRSVTVDLRMEHRTGSLFGREGYESRATLDAELLGPVRLQTLLDLEPGPKRRRGAWRFAVMLDGCPVYDSDWLE